MVLLSLLGLPYQLPQHVAEALHPFPRASTLCCMTRLIVQCWEKKNTYLAPIQELFIV